MKPHVSFMIIFILFLGLMCISPIQSDPRAREAALICRNNTADAVSQTTFVNNFLASLTSITTQVESKKFGTSVNGTGNNTVYTLGECMNDLSQNDCNQCIAQCKTQILKCLPFQRGIKGGRNYFDGCFLRYDEYRFFNEAVSTVDRTNCSGLEFTGNNKTLYKENLVKLVGNLSVMAQRNEGFFVGEVGEGNATVYGLAQCWKSVNASGCKVCLEKAVGMISQCFAKVEGRVLNAGCYLQYSPEKFYNNSTRIDDGSGGGNRRLVIILAVVASVIAASLITAAGLFFGRRELTRRRKERKLLGALTNTINKSELNYRYEVLEKATNFFNSSNKLGQGGSGSVYKGILPNGKIIAVKRLVFTTRQWVDLFFNEVNLISDVNHKNLVKLLGCSITGPESLLVYEYVPNQSLQDHLSDVNSKRQLSWEIRYNIIVGTAEGLTYLHEESNLRIIHRDIKLSNVLLDENHTAKIADFGLARLFPEDKTHISTAIAGTLGYMAPEYVVRGKLTEKADVYSFGVLVIEIVSGRRNNSFSEESVSILQMVWNCYGSGSLCEAVDPSLDGVFQENEAARVLQIGLLCTQASADLRPTMSMVVKMLTDNVDIPRPSQPPFLNSSKISPLTRKMSSYSKTESLTQSSGNSITESWIEPR